MVNFDLEKHGKKPIRKPTDAEGNVDHEKLDESMESYAKFISKLQNVGFGVDAKTAAYVRNNSVPGPLDALKLRPDAPKT